MKILGYNSGIIVKLCRRDVQENKTKVQKRCTELCSPTVEGHGLAAGIKKCRLLLHPHNTYL